MLENYWASGTTFRRVDDAFGGGQIVWTDRGIHVRNPYLNDRPSLFSPEVVVDAVSGFHEYWKSDYGNAIGIAGGLLDDLSGTKIAGRIAGKLALPVEAYFRWDDEDGFTLKDGIAIVGSVAAGAAAGVAIAGTAAAASAVALPAFTAAVVGVGVSYAIDALPIPNLPEAPPPSFPHNRIGFQGINPSTAYVPSNIEASPIAVTKSNPFGDNALKGLGGKFFEHPHTLAERTSPTRDVYLEFVDENGTRVIEKHAKGVAANTLVTTRITIDKDGKVKKEFFKNDVDNIADTLDHMRGLDAHVQTTYQGTQIGKQIGHGVRQKFIENALSNNFTKKQIIAGAQSGLQIDGPEKVIDLSPSNPTASSGGNRNTSTAQNSNSNSGGSDGGNRGNDNLSGGRDNPNGSQSNSGGNYQGSYDSNYNGGGGHGYSGSGPGESFSDNMGGCFVAGTTVLMADGGEKPIEQVQLEDQVMGFDGLGALEPREVTDLFIHGKRKVLDVDGVLTTPEHPFLLPDGSYQPIGKLSVGDRIVRADGSLHTIESIRDVDGVHTVYNFTVESLHTYVAAGFRVHNIKPVILDLDGDGLEVTALDRSTVFLDTGGDGFLHRTAWAGEGDGVLYFDPDGRNEITEKRQFVFTEWDPTSTSDLEALASVFDTNGDGVLNASDTDFAKISTAHNSIRNYTAIF